MPQDLGRMANVFSLHGQQPACGLRLAVPGAPAPFKAQDRPATATKPAAVNVTTRAPRPSGPLRLPKKPTATPGSSLQVQQPQVFKKRKPSLKFNPTGKLQVHKNRLVFHSQQHLASRRAAAVSPSITTVAAGAGTGCTGTAPLPAAAEPPCQQVVSSGEQLPQQLAASCLAAQLLLQRAEDEASPAAAELLRKQLAQSIKQQAAAAAAAERAFDVALAVQQLLPALREAVLRVCAAAEAHQAAVTAAALLAELAGAAAQRTPAKAPAATSSCSFQGQRPPSPSASPGLQLQQLMAMPAATFKELALVTDSEARLISCLATA